MTEKNLWLYVGMDNTEIGRRLLKDEIRDFERRGIKNFVIGFSYQGEVVISKILFASAELDQAYMELIKLSRNKENVGWLAIPLDQVHRLNPYRTRVIGEEKHIREAI